MSPVSPDLVALVRLGMGSFPSISAAPSPALSPVRDHRSIGSEVKVGAGVHKDCRRPVYSEVHSLSRGFLTQPSRSHGLWSCSVAAEANAIRGGGHHSVGLPRPAWVEGPLRPLLANPRKRPVSPRPGAARARANRREGAATIASASAPDCID